MSVAGLNYHKFADQVAQDERVYTFTEAGELLIFPVRDEDRARLSAVPPAG